MMHNLKLITQHSPWFVFLCLFAGLVYAYILYTKKSSWSKGLNIFLAVLRGSLVTLLCLLLLGPYIKQFKNNLEQPSFVIAIDNSQSIHYGEDTTRLNKIKDQLGKLADDLKDKKATVEVRVFDQTLSPEQLPNISFSHHSSNISQLLSQIQSDYTNRNLAGIVLLSDGIYNQGVAPNFQNYRTPVYTVGLGDTIPKKDINIKSLLYNKISYTGNKFPIVAEIHNTGFKNQPVLITLKQKNQVIAKQQVIFKTDKGITEVKFEISSDKPGLQHYVVEALLQPGEFTKDNNVHHAYVEVIEGKEKILLIATSPHPDIKAIRSAIEKKENYELQVYIPGINEFKNGKFDLVIFHQVPDFYNSARELKDKFLNDETSLLFIAGSQTNLTALNSDNKVLKIFGNFNQTDQVTPVFNAAFDKFKFDQDDIKRLNDYPPITIPFGNFSPSPEAEVILYQKVGMIATQKPLLCISNKGKKSGVFVGEGLWQWQLHEYQETKETKTFDKLITNMIQFLSSKEDKRKFRAYPILNEFSTTEPVLFEVEAYNDIYEKIYGQKIDLKVSDENGNVTAYSFNHEENSPRWEIKGLKEGIYKYNASANILGKTEKSAGEFSIKQINLESINTTADHGMLQLLSAQSGGRFILPAQLESLPELIGAAKFQSIIHTNEEFEEIINLPWVALFLLLLASIEWFIRKYKGSY